MELSYGCIYGLVGGWGGGRGATNMKKEKLPAKMQNWLV